MKNHFMPPMKADEADTSFVFDPRLSAAIDPEGFHQPRLYMFTDKHHVVSVSGVYL